MEKQFRVIIFAILLKFVLGENFQNDGDLSSVSAKRSIVGNSQQPQNSEDAQVTEKRKLKWVTEIFEESKLAFDLDSSVSPRCYRDFQLYKMHLQNQSTWAVKMFESSEWPAVGLLTGMSHHYGSYDECLQVDEYSIRGQYCLVEASYNIKGNKNWKPTFDVTTDQADHKRSAWETIMIYRQDPARIDRTKVGWALCIPASCTPKDLKISLDKNVIPIFEKHNMEINIKVDPVFCSTKHPPPPTQGYFIARNALLMLLLLIVISSVRDWIRVYTVHKKHKESLSMKLLGSFSVIRNIRKLGKFDRNTDISIIHGIKILNILFIVYGHRYIYSVGFPKTFSDYVEENYKLVTSVELVHTNVVDVFFMISGFLTYYYGIKPMSKAGELYYPMSILMRWIRMVPVFCVLMVFIIFLLPYMGEGPMWYYRVLTEVDNCRTTWWANLLAINNIVNVEKQCLLVSWYISADIQLCVIGGLCLYLITKNRKFGTIVTVFVFLFSAGTTFAVAYVNHYDGVLRIFMSLLEEPRRSRQFTRFYIATYTRVGPYLVGFLAGYLSHYFGKKGLKLSTPKMLLILGTGIIIGDGSQYYGCLMYVFGRPYNAFENAFYASINRSLLAGAYATVIVLYMTVGFGRFEKFLQLRIFVPMSRLTYSVFLVNTVLQLYHAASQRTAVAALSRTHQIWVVVGDVVFSYIFGILLYLYVEAPITNMTKMLQKKITKMTIRSLANGTAKLPPPMEEKPAAPPQYTKGDLKLLEEGVGPKQNGYCNGNMAENQKLKTKFQKGDLAENGLSYGQVMANGFHAKSENSTGQDASGFHNKAFVQDDTCLNKDQSDVQCDKKELPSSTVIDTHL